jgi:hypothetical protein
MAPETSEMQAIKQRLATLESQHRVAKRIALVIFLATGAAVAMGQAPAKRIVVADQFILKDSAGIVRATLGFDRNEPTLTLIDANGRVRANLRTESINFLDVNGTQRVMMGSSTEISTKLVEGEEQIIDQGPGLTLSAADKKWMVDLRGMSEGGSLSLFGQSPANSDRQQAVLASTADGPSLTLSDTQGFKAIVGKASLRSPSTGTTSKTSAASVILFDKQGASVWSAP